LDFFSQMIDFLLMFIRIVFFFALLFINELLPFGIDVV
jgi:hypothetical protein